LQLYEELDAMTTDGNPLSVNGDTGCVRSRSCGDATHCYEVGRLCQFRAKSIVAAQWVDVSRHRCLQQDLAPGTAPMTPAEKGCFDRRSVLNSRSR
jgi:hypothetical protein